MLVEVYLDTVCPWCRIGEKHLKLALERWQGEPVEVIYRSFFLNPSIPAEGYDFRTYMFEKGGRRVPVERFFEMPREAGKRVGLAFNFEAIERAPNTELSHRLIKLAPEAKREALLEAIFAAYFEHGQDIGDMDTLLEIAGQEGLDREELRAALESGAARAEVQQESREAHRLGISGVPFFIIDRKLAFSGAQPPDVVLRALEEAAQDEPESQGSPSEARESGRG